MGRKQCTKEPFRSQNEAFVASLAVKPSITGSQPIATYKCNPCSARAHRKVWHYTGVSQIKDRNRGTRRSRRQ
jgi:hypothetical protein